MFRRKELSIAIMLGAATIAACDRPSTPAAASPPERFSRSSSPTLQLPLQPAAEALRDPQADQAAVATLPSRDSISDAAISGKIKAAIVTDPGMSGADVSVHTDRGVVLLAGTVVSHEQSGIASAHAQRQDGVMRVDTHLALNLQ